MEIKKAGVICIVFLSVVLFLSGCIFKEPQLGEFPDLRGTVLLLRRESLRKMDLSRQYPILIQAVFDTNTRWPSKDKMPENFDPVEILEMGKNPGLGVRDLHKMGIKGQGVNVAVIDQPLREKHVELKGKVRQNTKINCEGERVSMHGVAVASILVGETCGVAPGASLHYWAIPSGRRDYASFIEALDEIMAYNKDKPLEEQIRLVSVSMGYMFDYGHLDDWQRKLREAEESGLIVVHCGQEGDKIMQGIRCPIYADKDEVDSYGLAYIGFGQTVRMIESMKFLFVPVDNRTQAGFLGNKEYFYSAQGGMSWAAPYLAGVMAMGLQLNPRLTEVEIYQYLRETGTPFMGGQIINPQAFIQKIKESA